MPRALGLALRSLVGCAWLAACGDGEHATRSSSSAALAEGVVANVDGVAITLAEVQRLTERGGVAPEVALTRLESEVLLAREAERRGYADTQAVMQVAEQACVQVLLERDVESQKPSEAEIDTAYANSETRFKLPERRTASHVLAVVAQGAPPEQDAAARAFARDAIAKLKAAGDPGTALEGLKATQNPLFQVTVEALPSATREGTFVKEFSEALFSLDRPGIVAEPVRTQFGWHAIWVREIVPRQDIPESVARAELSRELDQSARQRRADALLRRLTQRANITYAPKLRDALAALEF